MTSPLNEAIDRLKDAVDRYGQAVTKIEHESVSPDQILEFSTGGLDFLNTLLILISGGVTFLSGGASLTNKGQQSSERVFNSFGIDERWWDEIRCAIAVLALSVLILFWQFGLSNASECYTYQARPSLFCFITGAEPEAAANGASSGASIAVQESNYQRAIALDPDNFWLLKT